MRGRRPPTDKAGRSSESERCARPTCWRITLNTSLRVCQEQLLETGEFTLPGIATLVLRKRGARSGRNPATGETITISARSVVRTRIAKQLKDAVVDW